MSNVLDLMALTVDDFSWYEAGTITTFVERNLPQIVDELAVDGEVLTVTVVDSNEVPDYDEMKIAFVFKGLFLPVYENGDFYVKPDGSYATRKRSDGYALLGIRNES
ncbi:hypothetical protein [Vibrio alginolyticus]|uniref:hypothetical protein n=1 Tax=Vibrio alginolyticus TaxID=663 RepID=UPI0007210D93|nr:hypothetical protein [Vibrio alginolyticus]ALR91317.1 hypothetical protein AT730_02520 [Vibrio alginolyticus]MBY7707987.1 hypothetical protein [Vibrio alginolyticus]